ncbi:MAG: signal peptidase I, partial [Bacteroidaceae bacterium]|nr:signal peptidase I [Bacteroidaceae bacterium]
FFQNYVIPSSSLEKSLLTVDYLFVSKVSYGPRTPNTPLTMPLTQNTLAVINTKSYIEWPQWPYKRSKGLGTVQLNDIVVFNYPSGDTIVTDLRYQAQDFYTLCMTCGLQQFQSDEDYSNINPQGQRDLYQKIYNLGHKIVEQNPQEFGSIDSRPVDRRENYVKRCVGLPGQTLQIKDREIYLDGKKNKQPDEVQFTYSLVLANPNLRLLGDVLDEDFCKEYGITKEDIDCWNANGFMPMTKRTVEVLKSRKDICKSIALHPENTPSYSLYPHNMYTGWSCDNYGPIWIPKKGESINLDMGNIAIYERCIKNYEGNDLEVRNNKIYINGKESRSYTFQMDYYWMMGDNRHNSADSRFWGFVPEDHIVGKPIFIWFSSDPDRGGFSGIRWNRLFRFVDNIK